jgi:5-methylcytosine-specific restriction endonuclease McrA
LYCSKKCFFDARNSGDQKWDTTNQRKASWHRSGPYATAPSVRLMKHVANCHLAIVRAGNAFSLLAARELNRPSCDHCGNPCNDRASRFCSRQCNKAWRGDRHCACGTVVHNSAAFGLAPHCRECRRQAARLHKRMYGCYRRRCRTYGGFFNPEVKPNDVFVQDKWRCHICGRKTSKVFSNTDPRSATVDHHPIPLSKGGDHEWHNVRCACFECNSKKGAKWDKQNRLRFLAR